MKRAGQVLVIVSTLPLFVIGAVAALCFAGLQAGFNGVVRAIDELFND